MLRTEVVGDGKFDKLWELMKEHLPSGASLRRATRRPPPRGAAAARGAPPPPAP